MTKVHGFVLVPNEEEEKRSKSDLNYFSNDSENLWRDIKLHITLFLCSFDSKEKINEAKKITRKFASELQPLVIAFGAVGPLGDKYIETQIQNKSDIYKYHKQFIELIQPISKGCFNPKYLEQDLNIKQQSYLKDYGYFRIKEYFSPHITLAKYETSEVRDMKLSRNLSFSTKIIFDIFQFDESDGDGKPAEILLEEKLGL